MFRGSEIRCRNLSKKATPQCIPAGIDMRPLAYLKNMRSFTRTTLGSGSQAGAGLKGLSCGQIVPGSNVVDWRCGFGCDFSSNVIAGEI